MERLVGGFRAYSPKCVEELFSEVCSPDQLHPHMMRLISVMTRAAKAQMTTRQTANVVARRRPNLTNGASMGAISTTASATPDRIATTDAGLRGSRRWSWSPLYPRRAGLSIRRACGSSAGSRMFLFPWLTNVRG